MKVEQRNFKKDIITFSKYEVEKILFNFVKDHKVVESSLDKKKVQIDLLVSDTEHELFEIQLRVEDADPLEHINKVKELTLFKNENENQNEDDN